jgi:hypothetical protein
MQSAAPPLMINDFKHVRLPGGARGSTIHEAVDPDMQYHA